MNNDYNITEAFNRIEDKLLNSMKRNLSRHLQEERDLEMNWSAWQAEQLKSLNKYRKENSSLFLDEFNQINDTLEELIRRSNQTGRLEQEKIILNSIKKGNFKSQDKEINKLYQNYKKSKNKRIKKKYLQRLYDKVSSTESTFFKINERKLNALIKETKNNFRKAEASILRYTNDKYRKIIFDAQVYASTGSATPQQAVDMATRDFLSSGINSIEYTNGAMVNIASYISMALRTAQTRARLYGEGSKRDEWGVHTVLVPNRGIGCPKCVAHQGKIYIDDVYSNGTTEESKSTGYPLLSYAMKQGLLHPNCKDGVETYFSGINSETRPPTQAEIEYKKAKYAKEQKLNYINNNIEKYKRLENGSFDKDNIEKYHQKVLDWKRYKRKFINDNSATFNDVNKVS